MTSLTKVALLLELYSCPVDQSKLIYAIINDPCLMNKKKLKSTNYVIDFVPEASLLQNVDHFWQPWAQSQVESQGDLKVPLPNKNQNMGL